MKCYKITIEQGANPYIAKDVKEVLDFMKTDFEEAAEWGEVGDIKKIETIEMTKDEFKNLPEWDGP